MIYLGLKTFSTAIIASKTKKAIVTRWDLVTVLAEAGADVSRKENKEVLPMALKECQKEASMLIISRYVMMS